MGNKQTKFSTQQWEFDHHKEYYDIYRSKNGLYAQKHLVANKSKVQPTDEMQIYYFRHQTDRPIVHVYSADYQKSQQKCGNQKYINVYSQFIPYRLSDTINLTFGQALYVLSQSFYGFQELHYRFGTFPITDDHIGFNEEGEVRVWHSPNFGSNHLPHNSILLMSTKSPRNFDNRIQNKQEEEMVQDIWLAINCHANIRRDFMQRARWFRDMKFKEAREIITKQIQQTTEFVPDVLNFRDSKYRGESNRQYEYNSHMKSNGNNNYNQQHHQNHQQHHLSGNNTIVQSQSHYGQQYHQKPIMNPNYGQHTQIYNSPWQNNSTLLRKSQAPRQVYLTPMNNNLNTPIHNNNNNYVQSRYYNHLISSSNYPNDLNSIYTHNTNNTNNKMINASNQSGRYDQNSYTNKPLQQTAHHNPQPNAGRQNIVQTKNDI